MTGRRYLRIKPYDPSKPYNPGTEAQQKARRRTWRIIQLRSLWTLSTYVRTPWRLWLIRWLLDGELASMGAEKHGVRHRRQRQEQEAEWARLDAARKAHVRAEYELPF